MKGVLAMLKKTFKKLPFTLIPLLCFSSCSNNVDYQAIAKEQAKNMKVNPIYKTILDDYYNYHYDELVEMVETDCVFYKSNENLYMDYYHSFLDGVDLNNLKRDELKIGYAAGTFNGGYLVYISYRDYYWLDVRFGTPFYIPYEYDSGDTHLKLYVGYSQNLPRPPLLYYNHEFFSLDEGFEKGVLTIENTKHLQNLDYLVFNSCVDVANTYAFYGNSNRSPSVVYNVEGVFPASQQAIAKYINDQHLYDAVISPNDVVLRYQYCGLTFYDVPKINLYCDKGSKEYVLKTKDKENNYFLPGDHSPMYILSSGSLVEGVKIINVSTIQEQHDYLVENNKITSDLFLDKLRTVNDVIKMSIEGTLGLFAEM